MSSQRYNQKLVDGYLRRLVEVKIAKGHLTVGVPSSQYQHVVTAEPGEDGVYSGLEALEVAQCAAAGCFFSLASELSHKLLNIAG